MTVFEFQKNHGWKAYRNTNKKTPALVFPFRRHDCTPAFITVMLLYIIDCIIVEKGMETFNLERQRTNRIGIRIGK